MLTRCSVCMFMKLYFIYFMIGQIQTRTYRFPEKNTESWGTSEAVDYRPRSKW
jgi:hypothetical protein